MLLIAVEPIVAFGQVQAIQQIFGVLRLSHYVSLHTLRPFCFDNSFVFDTVFVRFTVKKLFDKSERRLVVCGVSNVDFQQPF
jgi:hypothetical protein